MVTAPETRGTLRFACTQCGACCNRSPEVVLSEAAALSDVFVFRLMFQLYWLPRALEDYQAPGARPADRGAAFYETKRLLNAYAARKYSARLRRDGKASDYTKYLIISALALDTSLGACSALNGRHCGIYERRPFACRTLPFHYSRPEALAESDLKLFVETPGHDCETGDGGEIVLDAGRIIDRGMADARADALRLAGCERRWTDAIVRRMSAGPSARDPLPSLGEIEANARFGVTTASMRIAWQIAGDAGLLAADQWRGLVAAQLAVIDRTLAAPRCPPDTREALVALRGEYRHHLNG